MHGQSTPTDKITSRISHCQRIGRKGGMATFRKYGANHMRRIGKVGFAATVAKHWNGDRQACIRRLIELGLMAGDPFPQNGAWQFPKRDNEPW